MLRAGWRISFVVVVALVLLLASLPFVQALGWEEKGRATSPGPTEVIELNSEIEYRLAKYDGTDQGFATLVASDTATSPGWKPYRSGANPPDWKSGGDVELWLRLHVPHYVPQSADPSLLLQSVDQYVEVWNTAGKFFASQKITSVDKYRGVGWPIYTISIPLESEFVYLRVLSRHINIGIVGVPLFGPRSSLVAMTFSQGLAPFTLGVVFCFFGVLSLILFLRSRDDRGFLGYAGYVFCTGVYAAIQTKTTKAMVTDGILLMHLEIWSLFLASPSLCYYFEVVFKEFKIIPFIRMLRWSYIIYVAAGLVAVFGFGVELTKLLAPYQLVMFVMGVTMLVTSARAALKRDFESVLFFSGYASFFVAAVTDLLSSIGLVSTGVRLTHVGLAVFVACMGFILAQRVSLMHRRLGVLAGELSEKNKELLRLDKLKDEFLANTSHELRTPLVGIIGLAESLIAGASGRVSESAKQSLQLIMQSGYRLSRLVNDILDFSKMREKNIDVEYESLDLGEYVALVLATSVHLVGNKDIVVENNIEKGQLVVRADENRLQQILYNLFGNAVKFTEKGSVTLDAEKRGDEVVIRISDTGIGIDSEVQARLFRPFEQGDASTTRKFGGTGLGLAVSKAIVEKLGGRIWVESEPGKGSSFFFSLKASNEPAKALSMEGVHGIAKVESVEAQKEPQEGEEEVKKISRGTSLLIVDDEPVNRKVLETQLQHEGYKVFQAEDGPAAQKYLIDNPLPDCILLDVMMPGMSGYEVCRWIRERYPMDTLPVIFITAKNFVGNLVEGFQSGANDYVAKPYLVQELVARIETQIKTKRLSDTMTLRLRTSRQELQVTQHLPMVLRRLGTQDDPLKVIGEGMAFVLKEIGLAPQASVDCAVYFAAPRDEAKNNVVKMHMAPLSEREEEVRELLCHGVTETVWSAEEHAPARFMNVKWGFFDGRLMIPLWNRKKPLAVIEVSPIDVTNITPHQDAFIGAIQTLLAMRLGVGF